MCSSDLLSQWQKLTAEDGATQDGPTYQADTGALTQSPSDLWATSAARRSRVSCSGGRTHAEAYGTAACSGGMHGRTPVKKQPTHNCQVTRPPGRNRSSGYQCHWLASKICNVASVTSWDGIDDLLAVSDPVLQLERWHPLKFRNVVGDQYQAFAPGVSGNV